MSRTRRRTRAEFENPDLIEDNSRRWSGADLDLDLEDVRFHLGQEDLRDSVLNDLSGVPQRPDANVIRSTIDTEYEPMAFHMNQEDLRQSIITDLSGVRQPESDAYDGDALGNENEEILVTDDGYEGDEPYETYGKHEVAMDFVTDSENDESYSEDREDREDQLDPEDHEDWRSPADHEFKYEDEEGNIVNEQGELMDYESFIAEREQARVDALADLVNRMEIENGEELAIETPEGPEDGEDGEDGDFLEDTRDRKRLRLDEGLVIAEEATRLVLDELTSIQRYYDNVSAEVEAQLEHLINRQAELYQKISDVYSELKPSDSRLDIGTRFDVHLGEISSVWNTMQQAQKDLAAISATVKNGLEFQKAMPLNNYNL